MNVVLSVASALQQHQAGGSGAAGKAPAVQNAYSDPAYGGLSSYQSKDSAMPAPPPKYTAAPQVLPCPLVFAVSFIAPSFNTSCLYSYT